MPALVFLLMIMAVISLVDTRSSDDLQRGRSEAAAVAARMAYYHGQAAAKCAQAVPPASSSFGTPACSGAITVDASGVNPSALFDYSASFQSAVNNDWIVTAFRSGPERNRDARHQWGLINANLSELTRGSTAAGPYDSATGNVGAGRTVTYTVGGTTQTSLILVQVPPALASALGLEHGTPVIASRAR